MNIIPITVTSEDGNNTKTYSVYLYRSHPALLESVDASGGELEPEFTPDNHEYTLNVANKKKLALFAETVDEYSDIYWEGDIEITYVGGHEGDPNYISSISFVGENVILRVVNRLTQQEQVYSFLLASTNNVTTPSTSSGGGGASIVTPSANLKGGKVSVGTKLELSTTYKNAKIYYTTDGSTPTADSTLYTTPISIDKSMTVKYIVVTASGQKSSVGSQTFTVEFPKAGLKESATNIRYIKGYSNGTFKPDIAIMRYEMLTALNYVVDIEKADSNKVFPDVPQEYKEVVGLFAGAGIIDGYDDGEFKGEQALTRAEFVKVMSLIIGIAPSQSKSDFADASGHWAESYIADFTKLGYLKGYEDGLFHPDDKITRAEFTAVVNRIIKNANEPRDNTYIDLTDEHWAYGDIMRAYLD